MSVRALREEPIPAEELPLWQRRQRECAALQQAWEEKAGAHDMLTAAGVPAGSLPDRLRWVLDRLGGTRSLPLLGPTEREVLEALILHEELSEASVALHTGRYAEDAGESLSALLALRLVEVRRREGVDLYRVTGEGHRVARGGR